MNISLSNNEENTNEIAIELYSDSDGSFNPE